MITGSIFFEVDLEVDVTNEQELVKVTKAITASIKAISPKITRVEEVDCNIEGDIEGDIEN